MESNGVQRFERLSPTHINSYSEYFLDWFCTRILGKPFTPSVAMSRGTAVEYGVRLALENRELDYAISCALKVYDQELAKNGVIDIDGKALKEREVIGPSVEVAYNALKDFGKPVFDNSGKQIPVSYNCRYNDKGDSILIIGYLDFVFEEAGVVVDLKSTSRMPNKGVMPPGHRLQRAVYAKATKMPVKFCYASSTKHMILEDGDLDEELDRIRRIIRDMDSFLKMDEVRQWEKVLASTDFASQDRSQRDEIYRIRDQRLLGKE